MVSIAEQDTPEVEKNARATCELCGRKFAADRLETHSTICKRQQEKKRDIFDSSKQRTLVDGDQNPASNGPVIAKPVIRPKKSLVTKFVKPVIPPPKANNWKNQHEQFISSIRAARGGATKKSSVTRVNSGERSNKSSIKQASNYVQCPVCERNFNRAAAERHIPWCTEKQRNSQLHQPSANQGTEQALARFRARNGYRGNHMPRTKNDKARGKSTGDLNSLNELTDTKTNGKSKTQNIESKSSSASSKASTLSTKRVTAGAHSRGASPPRSKVKARLQAEQIRRRAKSEQPNTQIMKFKEKFPNHPSHKSRLEFAESPQFTQLLHQQSGSKGSDRGIPRTVPGVRTGGMSPIKDTRLTNGRSSGELAADELSELELLRARIKEMYLNGGLMDQLNGSANDFSRENSAKFRSMSRSMNDFLSSIPAHHHSISNLSDTAAPTDLSDPIEPFSSIGTCHQCGTKFLVCNAKYCHECGARRMMSMHSLV